MAVALVALAACGRIDFDAIGDGVGSSRCGVILESGDLVIDAASTSALAPLAISTPLDRRILFTTLREAEPSPDFGNTMCQLVAAGVQCDRRSAGTDYAASTGAISVHWTTVTTDALISVQRGVADLTTGPMATVPIAPVDLGSSFVLLGGGYKNNGQSWGTDEFMHARLADAQTLEVTALAGSGVVSWQVITIAGASVQTGDFAFAQTDTKLQVPIAAVDMQSAFPLISYTYDSSVGGLGATTSMASARLATPTELDIARVAVGGPLVGTWQVISVPYHVDPGMAGISAGMTSYTFGLPLPTTSVVFTTAMSVLGPSGGESYLPRTDPNPDLVGDATATLVPGPDGITLVRGSAIAEATFDISVVNFGACH